MSDTPVRGLDMELVVASEGARLLGAPFQRTQLRDPVPTCMSCGGDVPITAYLDQVGATTTIPCPGCGAGLPTYPAPDWLRQLLPAAQQVFGGDAPTAEAEAGLPVQVKQRQPEPVVMACPKCGGGLTVTAEAERTVGCEYCGASVFLPDELWFRLHPVKSAEAWTLTFTGPELQTAESMQEKKHEDPSQVSDQSRELEALAAALQQEQAMVAAGKRSAFMEALPWVLGFGLPLLIPLLIYAC